MAWKSRRCEECADSSWFCGQMKEVWDTFQFSINGRQNEKRFKTIALLF